MALVLLGRRGKAADEGRFGLSHRFYFLRPISGQLS